MPLKVALRAALLSALAGIASASGPYIGGGLGRTLIKDHSAELPPGGLSVTGRSWKVFAGYLYDNSPFVHWASEGGYRDSGRLETGTGAASGSYRIKGWDGALLSIVPIGPFELYAKVGGLTYSLDRLRGGVASPDSGVTYLWGGGAGITFTNLGIRLEYERVPVSDLDRTETVWLLLQTKH